MANQYNANTSAKFQTFMNAVLVALPSGSIAGFDLASSPGFTLKLAVSDDGQSMSIETIPSNAGYNNAFGPVEGTAQTRLSRRTPLIIPASLMP